MYSAIAASSRFAGRGGSSRMPSSLAGFRLRLAEAAAMRDFCICNSFAIAIMSWHRIIPRGVASCVFTSGDRGGRGGGPRRDRGGLCRRQSRRPAADRGHGGPRQARPAQLRAQQHQVRNRQALQTHSAQPERRPALLHLARVLANGLHPQGPGGADPRRQACRRSPSSRARSARSRSIRATAPNGGSCRSRPEKSPTCAAALSARTARPTPTAAWWARSSSSEDGAPAAARAAAGYSGAAG